MRPFEIMDMTMGIQTVMDVPGKRRLPDARPLPSNVEHAAGLEELYASNNMRSQQELLLMPDVGDGDILQPEIFTAVLRDCAEKMRLGDSCAAQKLVTEELDPLLDNKVLLQSYIGLMIGG